MTGSAVQVLERISLTAPLGFRFWDAATSRVIADGLRVTAQAAPGSEYVAAAVSPSGVFGFAHLPGLRDFEYSSAADVWTPPPATRPFVITVVDKQRRFLPFIFTAAAPFKGIFSLGCAGATIAPLGPAKTIPLFSAPARTAPAGMAALRASLRDPTPNTDRPAAWAVVEVSIAANGGSKALGLGMADAKGQVNLIFPYPNVAANSGPLVDQQWTVQLRAWYSAALDAGAEQPDVCNVLKQAPAALLANPSAVLKYGRELVVS